MAAQAQAHLRGQGLRLTAGRHLILGVLAGADRHLSAAEIRDVITSQGARLDLATTHRTLRSLAAAGLAHILAVSTEGASTNLYGRVGTAHQHVACTSCGTLRDVAPLNTPAEMARLADLAGVTDQPGLVLLGTCSDCAQAPPLLGLNPSTPG